MTWQRLVLRATRLPFEGLYIYHTLGLILGANSTGKSTRIKEELKRFQDQELIVLSSSSSFYILVIIMDCFDGYVGYFYNMLG